jgi:DNA-binding XRE family transcriptional regulator
MKAREKSRAFLRCKGFISDIRRHVNETTHLGYMTFVSLTVCAVDFPRGPINLGSVPAVSATTTAPLHPLYVKAGRCLRSAREAAGRTQVEVASAVGLTRTSLTNIEKGRQKLLLHTFVEIAVFLGRNGPGLLTEVVSPNASAVPFTLPENLPDNVQAQIAGIINGDRSSTRHARSSPKPHPRKNRSPALGAGNNGTKSSGS